MTRTGHDIDPYMTVQSDIRLQQGIGLQQQPGDGRVDQTILRTCHLWHRLQQCLQGQQSISLGVFVFTPSSI